jgi:molecular chaperone DnaK (HSP70)
MGGKTLEVSFLVVECGVFEVVSVSYNILLGGDNFNQRLLDHFV